MNLGVQKKKKKVKTQNTRNEKNGWTEVFYKSKPKIEEISSITRLINV